jgi:urea transport system permease protein
MTTIKTQKMAIKKDFSDLKNVIGMLILGAALYLGAPILFSTYNLNLTAKFICFAIAGVGIMLVWGKGGMLALGQGFYFGIGGYAMAMNMKLSDASLNGGNGVPDFMSLYGDGTVPGWWEPFRSTPFTMAVIVLLPALISAGLGFAVFKNRIKGPYFAILSQALAAAFVILLIGQQTTTGGTNGLNGFRYFFGQALGSPESTESLFHIAVVVLVITMFLAYLLLRSRFGELLIAVRDSEERIRFLGSDPANMKVFAYVVAAVMAAVAGALFSPIAGIISPADVGIIPSLALLAGVAIGGRTSLFGSVIGAILFSYAQNWLSNEFPSFWTYFQGLIFILVFGFFPGGVASMVQHLRKLVKFKAGAVNA